MADYPATRDEAVEIIKENYAKYGSKPWALAKIFNNGQEKWVVSYLRTEDPFHSPYIEVLEDHSAEIDQLLETA
jgi:hypothetical protein